MKRPFLLKKRGKYWYFRLSTEKDFHSSGQTNKALAERHVIEIIRANKKKTNARQNMTLNEFAKDYFFWGKCPHARRLLEEGKTIGKKYMHDQRQLYKNHIQPNPIANTIISEIKHAQVLDFRSELLNKGIGPRTVNRAIGILKILFKEGIFREELENNPTLGVGNVNYKPKEPGIFSVDELRKLFSDSSFCPWKDIYDYTCFLIAATTGMRRGEILALRWKNIDFAKSLIKVIEAWKTEDEIGKPKWNKVRIVPIPVKIIQSIKALESYSIRINDEDLVFCNDDGTRFGGTWWKKRFNRAMNILKIDIKKRNIKPHSLRHSLNTHLLNAGCDPLKIQTFLGWSSNIIHFGNNLTNVQKGYTHLQPEHLDVLVKTIEGIF